jgi:hypothetical protein
LDKQGSFAIIIEFVDKVWVVTDEKCEIGKREVLKERSHFFWWNGSDIKSITFFNFRTQDPQEPPRSPRASKIPKSLQDLQEPL